MQGVKVCGSSQVHLQGAFKGKWAIQLTLALWFLLPTGDGWGGRSRPRRQSFVRDGMLVRGCRPTRSAGLGWMGMEASGGMDGGRDLLGGDGGGGGDGVG